LSEEVVQEALEHARLRRSVAGMTDDARETLIDALLDQLKGERDGLPDELRERLLDGMIDELIAGKRGEREILGQDGVLGEITRRMVQRALEEELTEHLGYPAGQAPPGGMGNSRNGGTPKTLLTDQGGVRIDTPRDRKSRFEPQLVKKGQRRLAGLDEKIIALYGGGMTTREIETYISDLYGPGVSRETVSRVTAAVLEDAKAWQTRPLEQIYPILYLDALVIKIRDGQAVRNFSCYLAIGVNLEGDRDVLGMWFQKTEGAKFWLQVLTDLKTRGVQDVLVCCVDGLTGFPEAIEAVYPQAWVQTCLVHLVRSSPAVRALQRQEKGRRRPQEDLHRRRPRPRRVRARALRRDLGSQVPHDLRQLDRALGADRPVPRVPPGRPSSGLYDQHDRGAQPPDPQNHQDPRQLPRRGLRPEAALPRDHPSPREMEAHLQLEHSPHSLPNPLRRPHPRHCLTVTANSPSLIDTRKSNW